MQPYFFPYIGYFQLVSSVEKFVFYDDVNFIKQGWINRNKIAVNGKEYLFSLPVRNISSFSKIKDVLVSEREFFKWKSKLLKTLEQSYKGAPNFDYGFHLVEHCLDVEPNCSIADIAINSVEVVSKYLSLNTSFFRTSDLKDVSRGSDRSENILNFVNFFGATVYINPIGGADLYDKEFFRGKGVDVYFLESELISYEQQTVSGISFLPGLSIIDIIMCNSSSVINEKLMRFSLK